MLHGYLKRTAFGLGLASVGLAGLAMSGCARSALPSPDSECEAPLTFEAATFYAGATDYFFTAPDGTSRVFRIESEAIEPSGFGPLTAPGDEGPPEPDPTQLGQTFAVCKVGKGLVLRAEHV